ncbi:hypothetical protein EK21DRAFT_106810 [Setomelanomma holmii]|uniref:Uncharacterized protein n=1 Tax=Setomelanomma holmii TaxID=210430 RepID=A0A9P4HN23_9PLEO|nr:hypothetical protein EK21DRAFT_106810 [Setomelanomma holmii]
MPITLHTRSERKRHHPYEKKDEIDYGEQTTQIRQRRLFYACSNSTNAIIPIANSPHPGAKIPVAPSLITQTHFDPLSTHAHKAFTKRNGEHIKELCLGKYCWQTARWGSKGDVLCIGDFTGQPRNHKLDEWLTGCSDWTSKFKLRCTPGMGHGLFSKVNWSAGDILGPYLGELVPERTENAWYAHEGSIGLIFSKQKTNNIAYLDAETQGSLGAVCEPLLRF